MRSSSIYNISMDASGISVRPFDPSDAEDVLKWAVVDRVTQYLRWNTLKTKEEALSFIEKVAIPHPWRRSMSEWAHISYAVGVDHWGRGIVAEALRMAIPMVSKQFPQLYIGLRLWWTLTIKGLAQRVLQKVGFAEEGLLRKYGFCKGQVRDFLIYSFLSTDKLNN
ncbi:hypothetical protein K1719_013973 [Acacia pycnantha]|nr:hypothetical protein K1719_013973 [Acacia pycnantha]